MAKSEAKALVRAEREEKLAALVDGITIEGMEVARGLFKKADQPGYNPDADREWTLRTGRTQMAVEVYKQTMANQRERQVTERTLGVILLKNRMEEAEWEKRAQEVDAGVIDVEVK